MSQQTREAASHATVLDDATPELSRSYSEALLNAAAKEGQVEEALADLEGIQADLLERFPAFEQLLSSQSREKNDALLTRTLEGHALPVVVRFLRVLNRHGRLALVGPISRAARAAWDRRQNRRTVSVKAAVALDEGQLNALRDRLAATLHATPVLQVTIDPTLLGGLVVQVGDDVYDASVRNRLEQLRHRLIEGKTHEIQSRRDHFSYSE